MKTLSELYNSVISKDAKKEDIIELIMRLIFRTEGLENTLNLLESERKEG